MPTAAETGQVCLTRSSGRDGTVGPSPSTPDGNRLDKNYSVFYPAANSITELTVDL